MLKIHGWETIIYVAVMIVIIGLPFYMAYGAIKANFIDRIPRPVRLIALLILLFFVAYLLG